MNYNRSIIKNYNDFRIDTIGRVRLVAMKYSSPPPLPALGSGEFRLRRSTICFRTRAWWRRARFTYTADAKRIIVRQILGRRGRKNVSPRRERPMFRKSNLRPFSADDPENRFSHWLFVIFHGRRFFESTPTVIGVFHLAVFNFPKGKQSTFFAVFSFVFFSIFSRETDSCDARQ